MTVGGLVFFVPKRKIYVINRKAFIARPGIAPLLLVLVALLLLLAGCGGTPEPVPADTTQTSPPATEPAQPTDDGGDAIQSPLPTPQVDLPWDAEPAEGAAIVRGRIEIVQAGVLLGELYLAKAVPTTNPEARQQVDGIDRNGWTAYAGIGGRNGPEGTPGGRT